MLSPMNSHRSKFRCLACGLALGAFAVAAVAQDPDRDPDAPAPARASLDPVEVASHKARYEHKHVLVLLGGREGTEPVATAMRDRAFRFSLTNDYELVALDPTSSRAAADRVEALATRFDLTAEDLPALAIVRVDGQHLVSLPSSELLVDGSFASKPVIDALQRHKPPTLDARTVLAEGLERAKTTDRNTFIFLSSPG